MAEFGRKVKGRAAKSVIPVTREDRLGPPLPRSDEGKNGSCPINFALPWREGMKGRGNDLQTGIVAGPTLAFPAKARDFELLTSSSGI